MRAWFPLSALIDKKIYGQPTPIKREEGKLLNASFRTNTDFIVIKNFVEAVSASCDSEAHLIPILAQ